MCIVAVLLETYCIVMLPFPCFLCDPNASATMATVSIQSNNDTISGVSGPFSTSLSKCVVLYVSM